MKAAPLSKKQEKSLCLLIVLSEIHMWLFMKYIPKLIDFVTKQG